jgi:hypothetical protein
MEELGERLLGRLVPGITACACSCKTQVDNAGCRHRQCCTCASGTVCDRWVPGC